MRRGFTLIEVMISIAILAIVMAVPFSARMGLQGLNREADYRFALRNAEHQLQALRTTPFDRLPPRSVQVGADGWVDLQQPHLVDGSVQARDPQGAPVEVLEVREGRMRVAPDWAGKGLIAKYSFYVADAGETHFAGEDGLITLRNSPVVEVVRVRLAQGEQLRPLDGWKLVDGSRLRLPPEAKGQLVVVDYLGETLRNRVSGEFLSRELTPSAVPSQVKLMRVAEGYGGGWRMELSLVRVAP